MFIGRMDELNFLEDKYHAQGGQLIVLYGRRRIGKTETLRKFCENKEHTVVPRIPIKKQCLLLGSISKQINFFIPFTYPFTHKEIDRKEKK